jgi:AcrR family transcriptional regulator
MIETIDTKTKILDTAEKLFGLNGFEGTSLRDITTEAQVNLAAINYHFQSKDSLIDAVIRRRIEPVNQRRIELLKAAGQSPDLEQIIEAFLVPVLEKGFPNAVPLIGRILSTPDQFVERVYNPHLRGVAQLFREAFEKALPDMPAEDRMWRLHFMAGTMTHLLSLSRVLPLMTDGICDLSDRKALMARLVTFLAAGFRAPVLVAETAVRS